MFIFMGRSKFLYIAQLELLQNAAAALPIYLSEVQCTNSHNKGQLEFSSLLFITPPKPLLCTFFSEYVISRIQQRATATQALNQQLKHFIPLNRSKQVNSIDVEFSTYRPF